MRKYTVTDKPYKDGEKFQLKGKTYIRSYIGGAVFDHEVKKFEDTEHGRMWKMYDEDRAGYYKKYHDPS